MYTDTSLLTENAVHLLRDTASGASETNMTNVSNSLR